ncbi:MAG: metallophosphoesterase [Thermoplasmata archaeon]|nr:metallophosphoesterase [Thermoplasmata archaeon]
MKKNLVATVLVAATVVASGALTAHWLGAFTSDEIRVEGGVIISESAGHLTIWCSRPDVIADLAGFRGSVVLKNCVRESTIDGIGDFERVGHTSIAFTADGATRKVVLEPPAKERFTFAVMGDSQGHNYELAETLTRLEGCEFALLCGDITPSGMGSEYAQFQDAVNRSLVPVYTTAGNHDVKNDGFQEYAARLGPSQYIFDYGVLRIAVVDSSDLNITEEQIEWIRDGFDGASKKIVATHVPAYDPFGTNHTLLPESCERVLAFIESEDVDALFAGHIHAFNHTALAGTDFVISGGAGATMLQGEHHYVNVTVQGDGPLVYEKCDVVVDYASVPHVTAIGRNGCLHNITFEDLDEMPQNSGFSSFENFYGNTGGEGSYSGVPVSRLVELVGGMGEGDSLRVIAADGYWQDYGYKNVFTDEAWQELQGSMIIALSMDSLTIPDWEDGPKLVMLPADGLYSNSDCEDTSYEDQGFFVYPSAGARWIKDVMTVQVIPCE